MFATINDCYSMCSNIIKVKSSSAQEPEKTFAPYQIKILLKINRLVIPLRWAETNELTLFAIFTDSLLGKSYYK